MRDFPADSRADATLARIDEVANRFEEAWRAGKSPRPEEFLAEVDAQHQPALLGELQQVLLELEDRATGRPPGNAATGVGAGVNRRDHAASNDSQFVATTCGPQGEQRTNAASQPRLEVRDLVLVEELGVGGMGQVYKSRDAVLARDLAVKVIHPKFRGDGALERRFADEAQTLGRLQHPGIVPIHNFGRLSDGRLFFTMKLVEGQTLDKLIQTSAASSKDSASTDAARPDFLAIFGQICQTLAFAHDNNVIHRDLKPANIMVGRFGEVQVMDWGIGKMLTGDAALSDDDVAPLGDDVPASAFVEEGGIEATRLYVPGDRTHFGAVLGTLRYMPKEQALGLVAEIDKRSDVFGLGAILCEILTGHPPYAGQSRGEVERVAQAGDVTEALARLDACGADPVMIGLAKRCLAPEKARRPANAGEVSSAVADYLASVPERLQRERLARVREQIQAEEERRRRRRNMILAALGLVLLGVAAIGGYFYVRAEQARTAERAQQARAAERVQQARAAERARRAAAVERGVNDAMQAARTLNEEGWKQANVQERWRVTLASAFQELKRAEDLLAAGEAAGDASPELKAEVLALRRELEQADAHRGLSKDIDDLLEQIIEGNGSVVSFQIACAQLPRMFRRRNFDVLGPDLEGTVQRVKAYPRRTELMVLLTAWSYWTPNEADRNRLEEVMRAVDPTPDASYDRWLRYFILPNPKAMATLASDADVSTLPPTALVLMANALRGRSSLEAAIDFLKQWQARFPDDFWMNLQLSNFLRAAQPSRANEAIRYALVATALRKESVIAHNALASAYLANRDYHEGLAAFERAIALEEQDGLAKTGLHRPLRFSAACAAALVGRGVGQPVLDAEAQTRWRRQAVQWLREELQVWSRRVDRGDSQQRELASKTLQTWKSNANLAAIRDAQEIASQAAEERQECERLWAEVDSVLQQAHSRP